MRLTRGWITPYVEERVGEIDGYGGTRLNGTMCPQYGCLRARGFSGIFIDIWLVYGAIEEALGELANMYDRNQLVCQYPRCDCGGNEGVFERGRCRAKPKKRKSGQEIKYS